MAILHSATRTRFLPYSLLPDITRIKTSLLAFPTCPRLPGQRQRLDSYTFWVSSIAEAVRSRHLLAAILSSAFFSWLSASPTPDVWLPTTSKLTSKVSLWLRLHWEEPRDTMVFVIHTAKIILNVDFQRAKHFAVLQRTKSRTLTFFLYSSI